MKTKLFLLSVLMSIVFLAGCAQFKTDNQDQVPVETSASNETTKPSQPDASAQISDLNTKLSEKDSQIAELNTKLAGAEDELTVAKVKQAVVDREIDYGTRVYSRDVFRDPSNKNRFVWLGSAGSGPDYEMPAVTVYDLSKDQGFVKDGTVTLDPVAGAISFFYSEKISKDKIFYPQGMDGSKFIIWETGFDNSPGPCFSPFLADENTPGKDLTAIDLNTTNPTRSPYTVSTEKFTAAQKEFTDCQKEIQSGQL